MVRPAPSKIAARPAGLHRQPSTDSRSLGAFGPCASLVQPRGVRRAPSTCVPSDPEPSRRSLQTVPSLARYGMSRGQVTARARARSGSLPEAILRHTQSSCFPGLCARAPTAARKTAALRPNRHTHRPARPFMCALPPFLFFSLGRVSRSEEHTSELQSLTKLVCRLLLEKKNLL